MSYIYIYYKQAFNMDKFDRNIMKRKKNDENHLQNVPK